MRRQGISEEICRASKGRGPSDHVRARQDQRTCTGCGDEALSAQGHAQRSAGATHGLKDGDEDAADRERTAAVPAGSGARQRRERATERARRILRRLAYSEETCRASKVARSVRSYEGVAGPRDVRGVRRRGALGARARAGFSGDHSLPAGWRQGGRSRPREDDGRAGVMWRTSEARNRKRPHEADIATTGHQ